MRWPSHAGAQGLIYAITADGVIPRTLSTGPYLALIAIQGLGIGTLLRNSAGGIMTTLVLLIVAPIVLAILSGQNELFMDISRYLPLLGRHRDGRHPDPAGCLDPNPGRTRRARLVSRGIDRGPRVREAKGRLRSGVFVVTVSEFRADSVAGVILRIQ
ncbi:hypothetical protein [Arthrobacter sp. Soil736]|uniref:hypothetical protein n=1 Tax=Arthrobacter sp. Soil736 TaxID=1736395 RepID=UPI000AA2C76E|nr:hypothetical protein [Arthrobacter sp. Soil736]